MEAVCPCFRVFVILALIVLFRLPLMQLTSNVKLIVATMVVESSENPKRAIKVEKTVLVFGCFEGALEGLQSSARNSPFPFPMQRKPSVHGTGCIHGFFQTES